METNIQKYQAFIHSAETGSFTKAAEILNFTQSGISKMIADLEKDWDVSLFERKNRQVTLTADGKNLLPYVRNLCVEFDCMQKHVEDLHNNNTGLIRIGTFSSVASVWLPIIIKRFQQDYPNIDYEFLVGDYRDVEEWLSNGRVDCGFLRLPFHEGLNFDVIPFYKDQMMVVLPENHPLASASFFPPEQFEQEPFIYFNKGHSTMIKQITEKYDLHTKVQFSTWDDYAIISLVEKGIGISVLPESVLRVIPFKVSAIPLKEPVFSEIVFVARNLETTPVAVKIFTQYLQYANPHNQ